MNIEKFDDDIGKSIVRGVWKCVRNVLPVQAIVDLVMVYESCSRWHYISYDQLKGLNLQTARSILIERALEKENETVYDDWTGKGTDNYDLYGDTVLMMQDLWLKTDLRCEWTLYTLDAHYACANGIQPCRSPFATPHCTCGNGIRRCRVKH